MKNIITHEGVQYNLDEGSLKLKDGTRMSFEFVTSISEFIRTLSHYEFFIKMEEEQKRK